LRLFSLKVNTPLRSPRLHLLRSTRRHLDDRGPCSFRCRTVHGAGRGIGDSAKDQARIGRGRRRIRDKPDEKSDDAAITSRQNRSRNAVSPHSRDAKTKPNGVDYAACNTACVSVSWGQCVGGSVGDVTLAPHSGK